MNGERYIKQAVIDSLIEHPDAEKFRQRAFASGNIEQVLEAMAKSQTLKKADFLAPDEEGKFIIDSLSAWKNFDKIARAVQASGGRFTYEDFTTPLFRDQQRTLLDSARTYGGLGKVFTPEIWQGRFEEMERLWYRVPFPNRRELFRNEGLMSVDLKRRVLEAEGREAPEDRLARAGLTPQDIRLAFDARGNFDEVCRKLERAGDYMRKEYVLMPDASGDTVFDNRAAAWGKYDAVVAGMQAHGERFEVSDFLRQVSYAKNLLSRAAEQKSLNRIFNPAHWVDRLPEMMKLWTQVLDGWKTSPMTASDFDNAYAASESATYAKVFMARAVSGKEDLFFPLNNPSEKEKPVLPLGLKAVWDQLEAIEAELDKRGEALTVADLRVPTGQMGNSCMMSAAKFGSFAKVVAVSRKSGENITLDDFLSKDAHGNTLIGILAEKNQLALVFTPQLWVGRVPEMKSLWARVPVTQRRQVDFQQVETAVKQATLKKKGGNLRLQPPKGAGG
jgi:hypothetical protein